jgi:hypothetical protein
MSATGKPGAVGLVYRSSETAKADRSWARALVIRHVRDRQLKLVDIYELDDNGRRNADVLDRLVDLVITSGVEVLVTDGVHPDLVTRLVADLGLRHEPVPPRTGRRHVDA